VIPFPGREQRRVGSMMGRRQRNQGQLSYAFDLEEAVPDDHLVRNISDLFRRVFERVVASCIAAGLVGGEGFAVDASLIEADANRQRSIAGRDWNRERPSTCQLGSKGVSRNAQ